MIGASGQPARRRTGQRVKFRVRDVYFPEPDRVPERIRGDAELIGTLVGLSDSGDRAGEFGLVEVSDGVIVVVPVTALDPMRDE